MAKFSSIKRPKNCTTSQKAHLYALQCPGKENLVVPMDASKSARTEPKDYKKEYVNSQRKVRCLRVKQDVLQINVMDLKLKMKKQELERALAIRTVESAAKRSADLAAERERKVLAVHAMLVESEKAVSDVKKQNRALVKQVKRASGVLARSIARIKCEQSKQCGA
ncbi:hypothetical protein B0H10DRAFT_1942955 [Mycena sp. CBHHK59/15]|nr:hypothetical protein B0H10DRAFT_1942955 [Mycena sp. CBHHK59/15]